MKSCPNCKNEVADGVKFCEQCGAFLEETPKTVCSVCGAQLNEGSKFCGECGARVVKPAPVIPKRCGSCGAVINDGTTFCANCGAKTDASSVRSKSKAGKRSAGEIVEKIKTFENKHCVITNVLIAVCAVIILFVSLFCPIKVTSANLDLSDEGSVSLGSAEIDQSLFQVLGSLGYIALDMSDPDDVAKVDDIFSESKSASTRISDEFEVWLKIKQEKDGAVTKEEKQKKLKQLTERYMRDVNQFAYMFAYTTVGALDHTVGGNVEYEIEELLDYQRSTAITALIFALVVAAAQIALAVLSLTFAVLAILGIVRKRQTNARKYFVPALALSGAGTIALAVSPALVSNGVMLAVALVSALAWFVYTAIGALVKNNNVSAVVKNIVCSALLMIAFFVLCAQFVQYSIVTASKDVRTVQKLYGSLGFTLEYAIMYVCMPSYSNYAVAYSDVSLCNAIVTLVLGAAAMSVMFASFVVSLERSYKNAEQIKRFDALVFVGMLLTVLFAIVPAIIGAVDSPSLDVTTCSLKIASRASLYCSIAFSLATFVFGLAYRPNAKPSVPTETELTEAASV